MTAYSLGRVVNHDPRSRHFPAERASQLVTVTHVHHGPVLDQGQLGSCTGNAAAQALNTDPLRKPGAPLLDEAAAVALYSWATHHDGFAGVYPPTDTGSSGLAVAKAAKHLGLITRYQHAFGLSHTLAALVLAPVIIGIPWHDSMFTPDPDGYVHPSGPVAGGHEVCLVGIDVDRRDVLAVNSWGAGWGPIGGFFRLTWADLGLLLADHGDATVLVP